MLFKDENTNITPEKNKILKLEKQLEQSKKKFNALFLNISKEAHLWKVDKTSKGKLKNLTLVNANSLALKTWNKNLNAILGKTADEIFGKHAFEDFYPIFNEVIESNQTKNWKTYFQPTKQHLNLSCILLDEEHFIILAEDITSKINKEKALKKREKIADEIFNNTFNFTGFLEPDGTLIDANKAALDFGGFKKEDIVGKKFYDAPCWSLGNAREKLKKNIDKAANGEFLRYEEKVLGKDNNTITIDFSLKPVFNNANKVINIIPEGRDVSEKITIKKELKKLNTNLEKKVEERTKELEQALNKVKEYKLAAELSKVGLWKWNITNNIQSWDDTIYKLYGVEKENVENVVETCFEGIHPMDRERVKKAFLDCKNGQNDFDSIFRIIQKNTGKTIFVRAKGKFEFDKSNNVQIIFGTKWDVSQEIAISEERNDFEKELKQQYNLISSASIILTTDTKGRLIEVNDNFCNKSGYNREELINKQYSTILEDQSDSNYYSKLNRSLMRGKNWTGLLCSKNKNGKKLWLQTTVSPFKNTSGNIDKIVSISFDITEQKNLEIMARSNQEYLANQSKQLLKISKELSKQKHLLQTVFDHTDFMIFLKDIDGNFILVNKQLCKNLGLGEVKDVIGTSDYDYFDDEVAEKFQLKDKEIIRGGIVQTFEETFEIPKGETTFLTSKFPIYDENNKAMGICGISVDITENKQNENKLKDTQTQLIQSEKMASIGVLTAGVAHEINNPLNYIAGGYQSIEKHLSREEEINKEKIEKYISWIKEGTQRATKIVRGLGDLTRDNNDYNEICDINKIINDSLAVINNNINNKVTVDKQFIGQNNFIKGNIGKLHQLFLNLFSNAIDAIEGDGTITININHDKENVLVLIKDTGVGIHKDELNRVIEPFYTTKAPGSGTGLGLYVCNNIVTEHSGKLKIDSKQGEGTSILIELPKK